jgi:hypothetical protein
VSETTDMVLLKWISFRIGSHVELPEFDILDDSTDECTKNIEIGITLTKDPFKHLKSKLF